MRLSFALIPLLISATPALAQEPAAPASASPVEVPRELTDPATANKLANAMQALSKAFLDLPIGDVQAAMEGRKPTAAEKKMTLRRADPNLERDLKRQMAEARPMIQQSMKALADALPSMMQGLAQAQQSLERAAANMPDPTYPKR
jgi:hypothetical protein